MSSFERHENVAALRRDRLRPDWSLECRSLTVKRGGRDVLCGVDFTLRAGECWSLIGANGAGKTTLMLALLGLLPPSGGDACLDGRCVSRIPPRRRGRWAAYVPQTFDATLGYTVSDVVVGGRFPHLGPLAPLSTDDESRVREAMDRCGLAELRDRPVRELSAGERQKTLIAAALAQDADAMFLDEPDAALDPAHQVELVSILRDWHAAGRALVVISHDLQLPAALDGLTAALRHGRIIAAGPTADVLNPERLSAVYGAEFEALTRADGRRIVLPRC